MIPLWVEWLTFVLAAILVAVLCWRLSKMHMHASIQAQCISDMLNEPDAARRNMIADEARLKMIENGTWRSG